MDDFKRNHKRLWQLSEYLFSGGVYFLVGYIFLNLFYHALGWSLWWSVIVSSVIGWLANYLMQRYWVFASRDLNQHKTQVTGRYTFITVADFIINYYILQWLKNRGLDPAIGQFIAAGFFTVWNYVWYRYWVFPTRADELKLKLTLGRVFAHRAHGHSAYVRHG